MKLTETDWTLLWRQLAILVRNHLPNSASIDLSSKQAQIMQVFTSAFYQPLAWRFETKWIAWVEEYFGALRLDNGGDVTLSDAHEIATKMNSASPKYIPREWMLQEAYLAAEKGDYNALDKMKKLFETPFDEHPELEETYYRKAPEWSEAQGGIGFMS